MPHVTIIRRAVQLLAERKITHRKGERGQNTLTGLKEIVLKYCHVVCVIIDGVWIGE
jgi:hypothetical protein